jgi:hypothetical protein
MMAIFMEARKLENWETGNQCFISKLWLFRISGGLALSNRRITDPAREQGLSGRIRNPTGLFPPEIQLSPNFQITKLKEEHREGQEFHRGILEFSLGSSV